MRARRRRRRRWRARPAPRPRSGSARPAATWCSSTRRRSRGTRSAATASPPDALRQLEDLGLDPAAVAVVAAGRRRRASGRRRGTRSPSRSRAAAGSTRAVARRAELDAALLDVARAAGADGARRPRVHASRRAGRPGRADGRGHRRRCSARYAIGADGMWSPLRKHLGVATPGLPRRVARLPPVLRRRRAAGRHRRCSSGSSPTSSPATPGRSRCPTAAPTSGFGIQRDGGKVARVQDMKAALARPAGPAPHRRGARARRPDPESPHRAWPIPARVDDIVLATGADAVRRRRRRRHRPDDRRGHRPGARSPARWPRRRSSPAGSTPAACAPRTSSGSPTPSWPTTGCRAPRARAAPPQGRPSGRADRRTTPWTRRNFARWLFEDYPRAVVATPRRWHRGLFSRRARTADAAFTAGQQPRNERFLG